MRRLRGFAALAACPLLIVTAGGAVAQAPPGATSCAGCHAPAALGSPVPPLAGSSADDITSAMAEYRADRRDGTIMARIAKGFSEEETRAIAVWLGKQAP